MAEAGLAVVGVGGAAAVDDQHSVFFADELKVAVSTDDDVRQNPQDTF